MTDDLAGRPGIAAAPGPGETPDVAATPGEVGGTGGERPQGADARSEHAGFALLHLDAPGAGEVVRVGGTLSGRGWVIAEAGVLDVAVLLGGRPLCQAAYGIDRPDVGERFPHVPQAAASGFSFSARVASLPEASLRLAVVARLRDGGVVRRSVALLPGGAATPEPIRIFLDHARVDAGGLLRVQGWVASLTPLSRFALFLGNPSGDDVPLGAPERGLARPDVAREQPDYPDAAHSGFRLVQEVAGAADTAVLRAEATDQGGVVRQVTVPLGRAAPVARPRPPEGGIELCCDGFSLAADGALSADGWAVAPAGLRRVRVLLDGADVGEAELGLPRPDVGNRFPRVTAARDAGLRVRLALGWALEGEHLLALVAEDAAGGEREVLLPVHVRAVAPAEVPGASASGGEEIAHSLDSPRLAGERAAEVLRGPLVVSGWAVAPSGLARVEVEVDGRAFGPAYVGVRRQDVANAFPAIEGALLSGFALTVPNKLLGAGEHVVRVTLVAQSGTRLERSFALEVEAPAEGDAPVLRPRVPHAELLQGLAVLAARGCRPRFRVLLRRAPGEELGPAPALARTLEALRAQAHPDWTALLLPAPDQAPGGTAEAATGDGAVAAVSGDATATPAPDEGTILAGWAEDGRVRAAPADAPLPRPDDPATPGPAPELLVVLDAGDLLGADALLELAVARALHPEAELLYADERRHDPALGVSHPFLKPAWSPELLLSGNYVGRPWAAASGLVARAGLDAAALAALGEYDAVLRLSELAREVRHVPALLCDRAGRAPEPEIAQRRALEAAVARRTAAGSAEGGEVLPGPAGTWRVRRPKGPPDLVSLVMPTCAARGLIETTLRTIRAHTAHPAVEVVVVDNIPDTLPDWKRWVREHADRVVVMDEAFNWSRFNNAGAAAARGRFLLFINDDMEVRDPGWLDALLEHARRPEVGVVGPQLLYPDGKVQHAGLFLDGAHGRHAFRFAPADEPGPFGLALSTREVAAVTGACMLMRREHFDAMGGFDEAHSVINNDLDFCLRTWRAGRRVLFTPHATLIHHELASRAKMEDVFDEAAFAGAWSTRFAKGDPFFNPGLSTAVDDFVAEPEPAEVIVAGHPAAGAGEIRRILAVKVDHIGDFVAALPALARLRRRFPEARITVLAARASLSLLSLAPEVDEAIEFNFFHARSSLGQQELEEGELAALHARLAPYCFDLAVDLRMQGDTRHLLRHTGARLLAGHDDGRFPWLDVALAWEGDEAGVPKRAHVTDRLLQLVEAVALACEAPPPAAAPVVPALARAALASLPAMAGAPEGFLASRLACIHPGAGSDMKRWPAAHYAALIDLLVEEQGMRVVLIGGPEEADDAAAVLEHVGARAAVHSLVGAVRLGDLPAVLRACSLYVGNDSGPKHLAATLGVPTLGVHSSNIDAAEWAPAGPRAAAIRRRMSCAPCYISVPSDCHRALACIRGIRTQDVYRAALRLLALSPVEDEEEKEALLF